MRVFVCEYVTGGGLSAEALPPSLAREAALMRDALRRDVGALPQVDAVLLAADPRLPVPGAVPVGAGDDPFALWRALAEEADVIWPVAPETGGILERLVRLLEATGRPVIACRPQAIAAAARKSETARRLAAAGLPHIPTFPLAGAPDLPGPRVTKPDDGAGCADTRLWPAGTPIAPERAEGLVVQPFVEGAAASLTVLAQGGATRLLCVNRQHILVADGRLSLAGLTVGGLADGDGRLQRLAEEVAAAFPGLSGFFGIDLVLTADGPVVVEVNPRLTTAYAGLGAALGFNPATLLETLAAAPPPPGAPARPVELCLA